MDRLETVPRIILRGLLMHSLHLSLSLSQIKDPSLVMASKVHFTLAAFKKASPLDLGPVAFVQWGRSLVSKSNLHTKYLAIASDAASSEDLDVKAIGKQLEELWVKEQLH